MKLLKNILSVLFLGLMCFSCNDDKNQPDRPHTIPESPFKLEIKSSSNPQTEIFYGSPDPGCGLPMTYSIYTDYSGSELVLQCSNLQDIQIDYKESYFGEAILSVEDNPENWIYIKDENSLVIKFPSLVSDEENLDINNTITILQLFSETEGNLLKDFISIYRVPEMF